MDAREQLVLLDGFRQEVIRAGIERSVESQMVSDVPFGAFLSGGAPEQLTVTVVAETPGDRPNG